MFEALQFETRLLLKANLCPVQGSRFQPTGFPDLGAATFNRGKDLIVESAQSVANRLEVAIWDELNQDVVEPLRGIPYVVVKDKDGSMITNSILESHRLNSYYITESDDKKFFNQLKQELGAKDKKESDRPINLAQMAKAIGQYDCNTLLHGVFFSKSELSGGRFKLPRAISGFIEAYNISQSDSGGTKVDRVNPSADKAEIALGAGNVPFHRSEFTADEIVAYFNLDLSQLRAYRMGEQMQELLIGMAIYKVQKFLTEGLRLRTACDLEMNKEGIVVTRPKGFKLPSYAALVEALPKMVKAAYPEGGIKSEVTFIKKKSSKKSVAEEEDTSLEAEE